MPEFLTTLFDTKSFPARWHCGDWSELHGWTHIVSDLSILVAYLAIPCVLLFTLVRMGRIPQPFPRLLVLFALFIVSCGITHLNEAIIFWHPIYRFAAVMKLITAIVSLATVAALVPALPRILALRTPEELEDEVERATTGLRRERDVAERFAALVDSSNDAIISQDRSGKISTWNRTAERLFGYTPAEVQGKALVDVFPSSAELGLSHSHDGQAEQPSIEQEETVWHRKDGEPVPLSLTISPVLNQEGETIGVSFIARDIQERLRAEQLFRLAVDASPSGMIATDASGQIVLSNHEAQRLFDYSKDEMLAESIESLIPDDYRHNHPELRRAYAADPAARAMGAGRELFAMKKDGSTFPVEIGLNPIDTRQGPVTLCAVVDRTEVLAKQASLERAVRDLEVRTSDLARSNAELEQFAYVSSHDLKAPLRGIQNAVAWIEEDLPKDELSEDMQENLSLLTSRASRMETMIEGLLSYARVGQLADRVEPVDCGELVAGVVDLLHLDPAVSVHVEPTLPKIETARAHLAQVFSNLISNANMHRDGKTIRVDVSSRDRGDMIEFAVVDDGPGIHERLHDRIFQIFQTVKPRDEVESTGIGLALVKKVVESYGGRISLTSEPGNGCRFEFTWPKKIHAPTTAQDAGVSKSQPDHDKN